MTTMHAVENIERALKKMALTYVYEEPPGITRRRRGKGFSFHDPRGGLIKDEGEIARLLGIAVPPSYTDVWYCPLAEGHLQATGTDSKGKKQYFYHAGWAELREQTKFSHMLSFGGKLPAMRRRVRQCVVGADTEKQRLICAMVAILDRTGMRIGSAKAVKTNKTYGLTTLLKRHVEYDEDGRIHFEYKGKGGGPVAFELSDPALVEVLDECASISGQRLFEWVGEGGEKHHIGSSDINAYIKHVMGAPYSAKDFRTWRFSVIFLEEMLKQRKSGDKLVLKALLEATSERTCNTPAVLKSSYIHPLLLDIARSEDFTLLDSAAQAKRGLRKVENMFYSCLTQAAKQ